jgi:hypothetical protein
MLSPSGVHAGYSATVGARGRVAAEQRCVPPVAGTVAICAVSARAAVGSRPVTVE